MVESFDLTFVPVLSDFVRMEVSSVHDGYGNQQVGLQQIDIYMDPGK